MDRFQAGTNEALAVLNCFVVVVVLMEEEEDGMLLAGVGQNDDGVSSWGKGK